MSTRLEKVIQQASTLPAEIQDEIAEQWLEDIENELEPIREYALQKHGLTGDRVPLEPKKP